MEMADTKARQAALRKRREEQGLVQTQVYIPNTEEAKARIKKYAAKLGKESQK